MDSIQWTYQPTAEEIKKSELVSRILSTAFYLSGLIYYLAYYFSDNQSNLLAIIYIIIYIFGLLFWQLFLKRKFVLGAESYIINNSGLSITDIASNKLSYYKWEDLKSFSYNAMVYFDKGTTKVNLPDIGPKKYLYIGKFKGNFIILKVPENQITKVYDLLKSRLAELS
jgi:hypothetical protein